MASLHNDLIFEATFGTGWTGSAHGGVELWTTITTCRQTQQTLKYCTLAIPISPSVKLVTSAGSVNEYVPFAHGEQTRSAKNSA
jgi:hypothetical protein